MGACVSSDGVHNTRIANGGGVEPGYSRHHPREGVSSSSAAMFRPDEKPLATVESSRDARGSVQGISTSHVAGGAATGANNSTANNNPAENDPPKHPFLSLEGAAEVEVEGGDSDSAANQMLFWPGDMFTDQYRVKELLGHGDVGTTYLVESVAADGIQCTLKLVEFRDREGDMEPVKKAQSSISRLQHDNVLSIYDVMENSDNATLVTIGAYASRGNLIKYCGNLRGQLDLLRKIAHDVASGLRVLHSYKVFHGSLKLEDVLEVRPHVFAVADAGFYQLYDLCSIETLLAMERPGLVPPEVFLTEDRSTLDKAKIDVWGYGILLYQLAFALNPFRTVGTVEEVRHLVTSTGITVPLLDNAPFPLDLLDVIKACFEKNPDRRPTILTILRMEYFRANSRASMYAGTGGLHVGRSRSFGSMGAASMGMTKVASGTAGHAESFIIDSVIGKGVHAESFAVHLSGSTFNIVFKALAVGFSDRVAEHRAESDLPDLRRQIAVGRRARMHLNVLGCLEFVDSTASSVTYLFAQKGNIAKNYPSLDAMHVAIIMLGDVLKGLRVLHSNGTYHCNLKPSNVFYGEDGNFLITDFGPIFILPQEVVSHPSGCIFDVPPATLALLKAGGATMEERLVGLKAIDTFAVGLIAAGVLPLLRNVVFDQFYSHNAAEGAAVGAAGAGRMDVGYILATLQSHAAFIGPPYTEAFIDFVAKALSGTALVDDLLAHRLFWDDPTGDGPAPPLVDVEVYDITEKDKEHAIKKHFEYAVDRRLRSITFGRTQGGCSAAAGPSHTPGQSVIEPHNRTSSYVSEQAATQSQGGGAHTDADEEQFEFVYDGDLACSVCQAVMTFVVYFARCDCTVRCGKCVAVPPTVALEPMAVDAVFHFIDFIEGRSMALLTPIDSLDPNDLGELEIKADLPTGSLRPKFSQPSRSFAKHKSGVWNRSVVVPPLEAPNSSMAHSGGGGVDLASSTATSANNNALEPDTASKPVLVNAGAGGGAGGAPPSDDEWSADDIIANAAESRSTELALFSLGLTRIPSAIFAETFASLTTLDLSSNAIEELPDLDRFACLVTLRMSRNKLTELPPSIGDLPSLAFLDVAHNLLTTIPQEIMFCDNLEQIIADYNCFDAIPECIFDMPNIQSVLLAENKRIDGWPPLDVMEGGLSMRESLKITIDNKPSIYTAFMAFEKRLPKLAVSWNRIYPDYISPNLYCGSLRSAQTLSVYEQLNIGYVLTMGRGLEPVIPEGMQHKTIIVDDIPNAKIDTSFDDAIAFIDESLTSGKGCLVHCFAGLSRSATAVIAYLMAKQGMRLDEAYMLTKKGRPNIYPNDGFFDQLIALDRKLYPNGRALDIGPLNRGVIPT